MAACLIGLGTNLGERHEAVHQSLGRLEKEHGLRVVSLSRGFITVPAGGPVDQPPFLNAVAVLDVDERPAPLLLAALQETETALGRQRVNRWEARPIDLDLLLVPDTVVESETLHLPHPRMAFRRFVLDPACDVAAHWIHPQLQCSLQRLQHRAAADPSMIVIVCDRPIADAIQTELMQRATDTALGRRRMLQRVSLQDARHPQWLEAGPETPQLVILCSSDTVAVSHVKRQLVANDCPWLHCPQERLLDEVTAAFTALLPPTEVQPLSGDSLDIG